jgi:hypothetical protein
VDADKRPRPDPVALLEELQAQMREARLEREEHEVRLGPADPGLESTAQALIAEAILAVAYELARLRQLLTERLPGPPHLRLLGPARVPARH